MSEQQKTDKTPDEKETGTPGKRNAFTELLSSRNKQQRPSKQPSSHSQASRSRDKSSGARDGLGAYIAKPESYPSDVVVYHNADFVAIHDLFPKSSLHLLLLPRDNTKTRVHPFDAFEDAEFLEKVKSEVRKLHAFAAAELRRKYGKYSVQDQARQDAMNVDPPPDELPAGRDWGKEIMCGIHANPSMNHLHIHVIAVDRYSERLKHRKHYNSFSTPFFVPIEDFPLAPDDPRRHPDQEGYLKRDFVCWRCGKEFGNKFVQLKQHLEEEFEEWKRL